MFKHLVRIPLFIFRYRGKCASSSCPHLPFVIREKWSPKPSFHKQDVIGLHKFFRDNVTEAHGRKSKRKMSVEAAISVLKRAVELDHLQSYSEALVCYQEGLALLMNVLKNTKDDSTKTHYRDKMESYIERAEKLKKLVSEQKEQGTFHEKIHIKDAAIGYSYRRVFGKYLEGNVTEVVVEDPYIRNVHQIYNFLRFCEMLVSSKTVREIRLLTTKDEDPESQTNQAKRLQGLKNSLKKYNITLIVEYSSTLHDREIRFSNGWTIKIGRGLDYFKPPDGKFSIGYCDFNLRECHETVIDIYLKKG